MPETRCASQIYRRCIGYWRRRKSLFYISVNAVDPQLSWVGGTVAAVFAAVQTMRAASLISTVFRYARLSLLQRALVRLHNACDGPCLPGTSDAFETCACTNMNMPFFYKTCPSCSQMLHYLTCLFVVLTRYLLYFVFLLCLLPGCRSDCNGSSNLLRTDDQHLGSP